MKFYHDWEFIDDGRTIEPISVGIVCESGAEYYAVNADLNVDRLKSNKSYAIWLREHVWPKLPRASDGSFALNLNYPDVKPLRVIASDFSEFLLRNSEGNPVELWGQWPAYDHVVMCQMYGRMVDKPLWIPSYTKCLTQLAEDWEVELDQAPTQSPAQEHHALLDARHDRELHKWIMEAAFPLTKNRGKKRKVASPLEEG